MIPIRVALAAALALAAGACTATGPQTPIAVATVATPTLGSAAAMYGAFDDGGRTVPAIERVDPRNVRQVVDDPTGEAPGTLVVDPGNRFLYLVLDGGKAMRYGVGVGRAGLAFRGEAVVGRKASWPGWTPTANMIRRDPEQYAQWAGGMAGGLGNPLGARALYLYRGGRDTLYRIHGTNQPASIGQAVSSGCIRLMNHDIVDLAARVGNDTRVVVLPA